MPTKLQQTDCNQATQDSIKLLYDWPSAVANATTPCGHFHDITGCQSYPKQLKVAPGFFAFFVIKDTLCLPGVALCNMDSMLMWFGPSGLTWILDKLLFNRLADVPISEPEAKLKDPEILNPARLNLQDSESSTSAVDHLWGLGSPLRDTTGTRRMHYKGIFV